MVADPSLYVIVLTSIFLPRSYIITMLLSALLALVVLVVVEKESHIVCRLLV